MVPRGRVELPTPAFSGPRSTGELPRHRDNSRFYGKGNEAQREKRPEERSFDSAARPQTSRDLQQRAAALRMTMLIALSVQGFVELAHPVFFLEDFARL